MKLLAWRSWSLRTKLVTACVLVELVAAALVLSSSTSLLQQALRKCWPWRCSLSSSASIRCLIIAAMLLKLAPNWLISSSPCT